MKKLLFIFLVLFSMISFAETASSCKSPNDIPGNATFYNPSSAISRSEPLGVLCCCATRNGGSCCAENAFCGRFVFGCPCSANKDEKETFYTPTKS
jgi:hypothetical protein